MAAIKTTNTINFGALVMLEQRRHLLTPQQYKTIKGQILAGETDGALRGLQKLTKGWKKE